MKAVHSENGLQQLLLVMFNPNKIFCYYVTKVQIQMLSNTVNQPICLFPKT